MKWIHTIGVFHSIAIAVLLVFLLLSVLKKPKKKVDYALIALLGSFLSWVAANLATSTVAVVYGPSDALSILSGCAVLSLGSCTFIFCEYFPDGSDTRASRVRVAAIVALSLGVSLLVFSEDWIKDRRVRDGVLIGTLGPYYTVTSLWIVAQIIAGFALLLRKYRRSVSGFHRSQIRLFYLGALPTFLVAVFFSVLLPRMGVHDLFFIGPDASLILMSLLTYTIVSHRMFDIRKVAVLSLARLVAAILTGFLVYAFSLFFLFGGGMAAFSWSLVFLLSLLFIAGLTFGRFIQPFVDAAILPPPIKSDALLALLLRNTARGRDRSLDRLLLEILENIRTGLPFRKGFIITKDAFDAIRVQSLGEPPVITDRRRFFMRHLIQRDYPTALPTALPPAFIERIDRIWFLDDPARYPTVLQPPMQKKFDRSLRALHRLFEELYAEKYEIGVPLVWGGELSGVLVLSGKENELPYYTGDIALLMAVRASITLAIQHHLEYERVSVLKRRAEADAEKLADFISNAEGIRHTVANKTLLYRSQQMYRVIEQVERAAKVQPPVLITGETGTGKELIARLIHEKSDAHNQQPFIPINCAAIPATLWEDELFGHVRGAFTDARTVRNGKVMDAGSGTLFLDEIGEMPLEMQAKMLRLVQERQFSQIGSEKIVTAGCRFLFATNKNLEECVRSGNFRDDLYYRINVLQIELPPLRERKEDLPLLIEHFLKKMNRELGCPAEGIDDRAYRALARYDWPGNIRELENLLIRTVAGSDVRIIAPEHLPMLVAGAVPGSETREAAPVELQTGGSFEERMRAFARTLIKDALKKTGGRKNRAAELLGMKRGRFFYQLKELGIQDNEVS